jgi:hypothetical protein
VPQPTTLPHMDVFNIYYRVIIDKMCLNFFEGVSLSDGEVDHYVMTSYWIVFSTYDGKQSHHTGDLTEHTGLFFRKVACSRYDVVPEIF